MNTYSFSRLFLKGVLAEVAEIVPKNDMKKAWVWTSDRRTWEFHFGDYFDYFHASDAYEGRAKGRQNWMARQEKR
jgi:hypothetical protein